MTDQEAEAMRLFLEDNQRVLQALTERVVRLERNARAQKTERILRWTAEGPKRT